MSQFSRQILNKFTIVFQWLILLFLVACMAASENKNPAMSSAPGVTQNTPVLNNPPVTTNMTISTLNEDVQTLITLNYTDSNADLATNCAVTNLSHVTITQACSCNAVGVCTVGITGTQNYFGPGAFAFNVTANSQSSNFSTATLTINPVNDAPVAQNIFPAQFNEDTQSLITLAYTDVENNLATSCSISSVTNVSVTQPCSCNAAGICTVGVTGSSNYNGAAGFVYTVSASGLASNQAVASLLINPVDDPPTAQDISPAAFNEDTQSLITLSYIDPENDSATSCSLTNLTNVTMTQACSCSSGICTVGVTGLSNYFGAASFNFSVTANGQTSNSATASLSISPIDDSPVANNISPVAFNEDTVSTITLSYSDVENDQATQCFIPSVTNVTVINACSCIGGVCTVGIRGTSNYNGSAQFTYTVKANGKLSNAATATLSILPIDDAPVANNITPASFAEDTESIITLSYSDIENNLATTCSVTSPTNVTVTQPCACNGAGVCTVGVTGALNYFGSASISYAVSANGLTSNSATANLNITAADDAPVASNLIPVSVNEDTSTVVTFVYSDTENDLATSCNISNLSNLTTISACTCSLGVCTITVQGTLNYNGAAGFDYTVTANGLTSNVASAPISISPVDDAPTTINQSASTFSEDTQSVISVIYSDVENDSATVCSISNLNNVTVTQACGCTGGVCSVGVTGTLNYNGPASFDFAVTANGQSSNVSTETFNISNVDDAPVAADLSPVSFNEDTQSIITLSYTDNDNDLSTSCSLSNLTNVTVTQACSCDGIGVCTVGVTGTANFNGSASFKYVVNANSAPSNLATASLTIDNVDDAPVAANFSPADFNEDSQSIITLSYSDVDGNLATVCSVTADSNSSITQACSCNGAGVCTVGITGNSNYNGAASFTYTVTANSLISNSATASFNILNTDDAPVAANISPAAFNEDTQSIITLSYSDIDANLASACSVTTDSNTSVTQACSCNGSGVCTVGITGNTNYNGAASFTYTVTANSAISNSATASLTINNVDDAPVAANITPAAFNEDTQSIITLSYSDVDGNLASACSVTADSNTSVTQACSCNGSGVCTVGITGNSNYNGAASFTYTVTANSAVSNTATATLTILNTDDAPVAANITPAAFNEDTQSVITLSYSDNDGNLATVCSVTADSNTSVTQACSCNGSGVCTVGITGNSNYNGAASFTYTVTANTAISNTATASLTINNTDDAPVAANITPAAFNEDTQSVITLSYSDNDGNLATVCSVTADSNTSVTQACSCNGSGVCTVGITGNSNYNGAASFTYTVTANSAISNTATATLTILNTDDAPVAANITPAAFNEDTQSIITLSYSDNDGNLASACSVTADSNTSVTQACSCNGSGVCTVGITGNSNYNGAASFTYTVTANTAISNTATATLTINNVDDAPVAANITPASFVEDTQSIITLSYSDVDGNLASACSVTADSNTSVTQACSCNGSGVCTVGITGNSNYNGAASFTYTVTANSVLSNTATASLTITNSDDAPVAINITPAAFNEDAQSLITLSYTDSDGDFATACSVTPDSNTSVTQACNCILGTCTVGITGNSNFNGSASFTYTVTANTAISNSASASLTINNVDDAPVAANITPAAFNEDTQSIITLSYSDVDGNLATACSVTADSNTSVTQACSCDGSGVCTVGITGNSNYNGAASFTYTVTANSAISNTATASLTINNTDDAPVAANITPAAFNEDTQSVITLSYSDNDGNLATACSVTDDSNTSITQACSCDGSGVCTVGITGNSNYNGAATFTYTVTANSAISNTATATLTINNVDDAPVASNINPADFNEGSQSIITLSYSDVDGNLATVCSVTADSNTSITQACSCNGSGVCTVGITGNTNYNGAASFTYTVTANSAVSNSATASFNILNTDDAPVAANISPAAFNEDTQSVITLSYSDIDGDLASACSVTADSNSSVTQACSCNGSGVCTVGITGNSNYNGAASFTYTVTANSAVSNTATATLTINNVDDAPVAANISPAAFNEDTQSIITLSYSDNDGNLATACSVTADSNTSVTQACSCNGSGVCTVGITGNTNYNGAASFTYTVTANSAVSNSATASLNILNTDDAPVTSPISPAGFNEDTQSIITLSYSDPDGDLATSCAITSPNNVTETQACSCNVAGVCTVGVTGVLDYNGAANFSYTVVTNSVTSNSSIVSLNIAAVDDAPVTVDITPANFDEDTQSIITLSYSDPDGDKATACTIQSSNNVVESQACSCDAAGVCTVGITGTQDFNGAASFTFAVTANSVLSNTSTANFTLNPIQDAPVAINFAYEIKEDLEEIITLQWSDPDGDLPQSCQIHLTKFVTVTTPCTCTGMDCTVGITSDPDYNGSATFEFSVTTNGVESNITTVDLVVNPIDDAPVTSNMSLPPMTHGTSQQIILNYSDVEGDTASTCSLSNLNLVAENVPCICSHGTCIADIKAKAVGSASFDFVVEANGLTSNTSTVSFTIVSSNTPPVANSIPTVAFNEDTQSVIVLSYTDAENDLATACSVSGLSNSSVTQACSCDAAGVCSVGITGNLNYAGMDSVSFNVTAGGQTSNNANFSVKILSVDDAPVGTTVTPLTFNEDVTTKITLNYTDVEGDQATSCAVSSLTNLTVVVPCSCSAGICNLRVASTSNYNGPASFAYTVTTNALTSTPVTANFTVNAVPDAPITTNFSTNMTEDTTSVITLSYSDPEGDLATVCSVTPSSKVSIAQACACDAAGVCTVGIKGISNYFGTTSATFTVTAGGLTSNTSTATLVIAAVDDAPTTSNLLPGSMTEDTPNIVTLVYNDTEGDFATSCTLSGLTNLTITTPCSCTLGTCTVEVQGTTNYNGSASFNYTVTSNSLTSNSSSATFTISAVDDAPVAVASSATLVEETELLITLNYTDVEGNLATACTITSETNATETTPCSCTAGVCKVGVTGDPNFSGTASVGFTVTANGLTSASSALATLTITNVDDAPTANAFSATSFNEDTQSVITLNYSDADNDLATLCTISAPTNVTVTQACSCNASGVCTVGVTGTSNYNGPGSFSFSVKANNVTSNVATASFTINNVDDAPVASNFSANLTKNVQGTEYLVYSDADGNQATSCSIVTVTNVTVTSPCTCTAGTCSVGVTGTLNYVGSANFTYNVVANGVTSNTATTSITISNAPDTPPVANNLTGPTTAEDVASTAITLSYTDANNDKATSCTISALSNLTVTTACSCNASGVCTVAVKGTTNYNGPASFNYYVTANGNSSNLATVNMTISAVNDAPTITGVTTPITAYKGTPFNVNMTINDVDNTLSCSTALTMTSSSTSRIANASVVFSGTAPNCIATVTPTAGKTGNVTLTFRVSDGALNTTATSGISIINGTTTLAWTDISNNVITSYDFGDPNGNTSVTLRVRNNGNMTSTANITFTFTAGTATNFQSPTYTTDCLKLNPNSFCSVTVYWNNTLNANGTKTGGIRAAVSGTTTSSTLGLTGIKN